MTPEELEQYIGNHNSSSKSKTSGVHENFGIGAKATCLTWNKYGLVYLSYTFRYNEKEKATKRTASMVWLAFNEEINSYAMRTILIHDVDEDGNTYTDEEGKPIWDYSGNVIDLHVLRKSYPDGFEGVKWWNILPPKPKGKNASSEHGTIVICCGNHIKDNTWHHDAEGTPITQKKINGYYIQRFGYLNDLLSVGLSLPHQKAITNWKTGGKVRPKGLREFLKGFNYQKSEISFKQSDDSNNEWLVETWINPKEDVNLVHTSSNAKIDVPKGLIVFEYKDEFYNHKSGFVSLKSFGIPFRDVAKRVVLIIKPPVYKESVGSAIHEGVIPNEQRDSLKFKRSFGCFQGKLGIEKPTTKELNYDWLKSEYDENKPAFLEQLIKEAYEKKFEKMPRDDEAYFQKFSKEFATLRTTLINEEKYKSSVNGQHDFSAGDISSAYGVPTDDQNNRETLKNNKRGESSKGGSPANNPEVGKDGQGSRGKKINLRKNEPTIGCIWASHTTNQELVDAACSPFENFMHDDGIIYCFKYVHSNKNAILYCNEDNERWHEIATHFKLKFNNVTDYKFKYILGIVKRVYARSARLSIMHLRSKRKDNKKISMEARTTPPCLECLTLGLSHSAAEIEKEIIKEVKVKRLKDEK
jgi:hypothetical protein